MLIEDLPSRRRLDHVGLCLTEDEARELRDKLETLLAEQDSGHEHVSSADFQVEVTVWIERR